MIQLVTEVNMVIRFFRKMMSTAWEREEQGFTTRRSQELCIHHSQPEMNDGMVSTGFRTRLTATHLSFHNSTRLTMYRTFLQMPTNQIPNRNAEES